MRTIWSRGIALLIAALLFQPLLAQAVDWSSCADDLDRLRRAARDANDAATRVDSDADDFENCKNYPDVYDLYRDGCQMAASEYRSSLSTLESELSTVDSRVRSVASSCGVDLSSVGGIPKAQRSGDQLCDLYRSYKGRIPEQTLMKSCLESKPEAECKKCLSGK